MDKELSIFFKKIFVLATILVTGILIYFASQAVYNIKSVENLSGQLAVSAEGRVFAKPDIIYLNLGVSTTASTTSQAISENSQKMNEILDALKKLGVEEKDIQTTNYNLTPLYDWTQDKGRVFKGYSLEQNIQVKIRDFSKAGEILEKSVEKGANLIGGLTFGIEDIEVYKEQARKEAIEKAQEKARKIAQISGLKIGKVTNYFEDPSYFLLPTPTGKTFGEGEAVPTLQPEIKSGQQEIVVSVILNFEIK